MVTVFSPTKPFICGTPLSSQSPLARFLPPFYHQSGIKILANLHQPNHPRGYILDPYGSSPWLAIELANAGAAVVVCCNNPILRILLQAIALHPQLEELQTILAEISALKKLDTRLESHLRSLYHSTCNSCLSEIEVQGYVWERDSSSESHRPLCKVYQCPHCGSEGQFSLTIYDLQQLNKLPPRSLLEAQAASRIVDRNDRTFPYVLETLAVYPTRSLYAILTLLNKLDELNLDRRKQQILFGLLVEAFDRSNSLWTYPPKRHRPKQLSTPGQFFENNFWQTLERSITIWTDAVQSSHFRAVGVTDWPKTPQPGEIAIFQGRLPELLPQLHKGEFAAVVTVLPRPNQAFWTLCALWSGWLEGKQSVKPLKSALTRKRYDWGWHCRALAASFQEFSHDIFTNTPVFVFIEEYEMHFLAAALLAADHAGLILENLTVRPDQQRAQVQWLVPPHTIPRAPIPSEHRTQLLPKLETKIASALKEYASAILEPVHFSQLHTVALGNAVQARNPEQQSPSPISLLELVPFHEVSDYPNFFLSFLENTIQASTDLTPYPADSKSLETRLWWISKPSFDHEPLSDQVEHHILDFLLANRWTSLDELDQFLCNRINAITVPSLELIRECLASYADYDRQTHQWILRHEESPSQRATDQQDIHNKIILLGNRLNYRVVDEQSIQWHDENGTQIAIWHIQSHAKIGSLLKASEATKTQLFLAIPGSRVNLLLFKLQLFSHLRSMLDRQIHIVRFRQIRWMLTQEKINRNLFENWLTQDPLKYQNRQLLLL
ncbi:MAG: hypothetical protein Kow0088_00280 [Anaerolineales bacterium]